MTADIALPLVAVFISVALGVGSLASMALGRTSSVRRRFSRRSALHPRLRELTPGCSDSSPPSCDQARARRERLRRRARGPPHKCRVCSAEWNLLDGRIPKRRLLRARRDGAVPIISGLVPLALMGTDGWLLAIIAAVLGYLVPDLLLTRATRRHQKAIQNGLPDAIDLIVVCVEAGSSLDQAIVRASDELELAHAGAGVGVADG